MNFSKKILKREKFQKRRGEFKRERRKRE